MLQKAFRKYFNQQKFIREKEEAAGNKTGVTLFLLLVLFFPAWYLHCCWCSKGRIYCTYNLFVLRLLFPDTKTAISIRQPSIPLLYSTASLYTIYICFIDIFYQRKERRRHSLNRNFYGDYVGMEEKASLRTLVGKRDKVEFAQTVVRYDKKFKVLRKSEFIFFCS